MKPDIRPKKQSLTAKIRGRRAKQRTGADTPVRYNQLESPQQVSASRLRVRDYSCTEPQLHPLLCMGVELGSSY